MVNVFFGHHLLEPLWSIGVEEVFYIIWAPLFKFFKKHLLTIILFFIVFKTIILVYLANSIGVPSTFTSILRMLEFESMAIGGLAAYLVYHRKDALESSIIFSKSFQLIMLSFILLRLFGFKYLSEEFTFFDVLFNFQIISKIFLTCSFAWLIVNVSVNKNSLVKLNNKVLNFLGDISYGVYMYHMLVIFALTLVFKTTLSHMMNISSTIVFYVVLTTIVILVSALSKKLFENYFLSLKKKFRVNQGE